ncbi:hypothetical protein [Methanobrevibacter sp.]
MSTNCKVIIGYTDHMGHWNITNEFIRWSDGYSEMMIPQIKQFTNEKNGFDIASFNEAMEYDSWRLTEIPSEESYDYGQMNYHYLIDQSNRGKILCSVLKEDWSMYEKYDVMNMRVEQELIL